MWLFYFRNVFNEAVEHEALRIALWCDFYNIASRKKKQQEILSRYSEKELPKFQEICFSISKMLTGMIDNFNDYLGEIYMEIGAANKHNQQYFTPMSVGRLMAAINLDQMDFSKPIVSMNDCCCGSGGLLLASLAELMERKINYTSKVLIVAGDISKNCVNMCYLQLAMCGATAVVTQQNALTQKVEGETFLTPAFILQYHKFKKFYDGLSK